MADPRHHPITDHTRAAALGVVGKFFRLAHRHPLLLTEARWGANPAKEVTESWAVVQAALRWAKDTARDRADRSVRVLSVGDGTTPRTALLLGSLTGWQITSIDPAMRVTSDRVRCIRAPVEAHDELYDLVLATHSHGSVEGTRARVAPGGTVIALPCCVPWPVADRQHRSVVDYCLSPDRVLVVERVEVVLDGVEAPRG